MLENRQTPRENNKKNKISNVNPLKIRNIIDLETYCDPVSNCNKWKILTNYIQDDQYEMKLQLKAIQSKINTCFPFYIQKEGHFS